MKSLATLAGAFLLLVWCSTVSFADEPTQAKNLEQEAAAAVQAAREHYFGPVSVLITIPSKSREVLPYFKKYAADPDQNVRAAVIDIAAAAHTAASVSILARMIPDQEVGFAAVSQLSKYDKSFLKKNGGETLKFNLLRRLKQKGFTVEDETILLLSSFPQDAEVLQALTQRRSDLINGSVPDPAGVMVVDVTLSEIGQADARARVQTLIQQGDLAIVPTLLMDLKFVDNPATLKSCVPLLRDKRNTKYGVVTNVFPPILLIPQGQDPVEYRRTHPQPPPVPPHTTFWRVCDVALLGLAQKTGVDVGIPDVMAGLHDPLLHPRNYTDAELDVAYQRMNTYFSAKK